MKAAFAARVNLVTSRGSHELFLLVKKVYNWDRSPRKNCQPAELRKVLVSI